MQKDLIQILQNYRTIPVASIETKDEALRIAGLLLTLSLPVIELTNRSKSSIDALRELRKSYHNFILGMGSVLSVADCLNSMDAGADFLVSPIFSKELVDFCNKENVPYIPGVSTPTELYNAIECGCKIIKLFPAEQLGGIAYLKALVAPFRLKDFWLMPTGGITFENGRQYLANERVIACGMSCLADPKELESANFREKFNNMRLI